MPAYVYKARDQFGKILQGQMEAADERDLRKKLDERKYFVIEYYDKKSKTNLLTMELWPAAHSVKMMDLAVFSWQLYTMLDAGLTLVNSLKIMTNQTKKKALRSAISHVCQRVEEGCSFSDALKEHPEAFSRLYVQMVNAGEVGGVLDEMIRRLAVYYERQAEIRSKIQSAMIYPALLLVFSLGVIGFLIVYVLPQFAVIFQEIGARIPWSTQLLLNFSVILRNGWYVLPAAIVVLVIAVRLLLANETSRYEWDRLKLRLPIFGELTQKTLTAQFTQTLAILIKGGIPILTALDVVTEVVGNAFVIKILKGLSTSVGEGRAIAQHLDKAGIFPDMVVGMIRVGEETGSLDKMLDKISDFYIKEVDNAITTLTKLLEPLLMAAMAVIIGYIAFSIFLPLADLMRNIRG